MEIKAQDLTFLRNIAKSGMAKVDLYRLKKNGQQFLVAKKSLLTGDTTRFRGQLSSEISILKSTKHEHIVEIFGHVHSTSEFGLVMKYYKHGSYHISFIETNYEIPRSPEEMKRLQPLKMRLLKEIACAMNFLHNKNPSYILHRDLKADNVLIDDDLHARLTDFGLSELKTVSRLSMKHTTRCSNEATHQKGTMLYVSPEHLANPRYKATKKTDVYAFGILAWQILADSNPYEDLNAPDINFILHHVQFSDCRPNLESLPAHVKDTFIRNVVEKSWDKNPDNRPNFTELFGEITQEIDRTPDFYKELKSAVEFARRIIWTPAEDLPKQERESSPQPPSASASIATPISWETVRDGIQQRGGISRLHYGEFPIVATTEFYLNGIKLAWECKCMDVKSGHSVEVRNHLSPSGVCEVAASRLVRQMVDKGIYPRPIDEEKLRLN